MKNKGVRPELCWHFVGRLLVHAFMLAAIIFLAVDERPSLAQQEALLSNPIAETRNFEIISNSLFLYSPSVLQFDIQAFLDSQAGPLKDYSEKLNGEIWSAAESIRYNAMLFGINPQVLLIILEAEGNVITNPSADVPQSHLTENSPSSNLSFYAHVRELTSHVLDSYEMYRYEMHEQQIVFTDNTAVEVPSGLNAGTYALYSSLAQLLSYEEWVSWVQAPPRIFSQRFTEWFGNPLSDPDAPAVTAVLPGGHILPFPIGETWYFTGGPHHYAATGARPWSSIDIAPPEVIGCPGGNYPANRWIVAAKGGTVIQSSQALVVIEHDGGSWRTYYSHVSSADRRSLGGINQGDHLGHPSCEVEPGGRTTGVHVHFAIWQSGVGFVNITGSSLSDWLIQETTHYNGTMTRNGVVRTATVGRYNGTNDILNSGIVTSCPQSGGVILYWNANYNCSNGSGDAGYRQRTSTGWQNVNDGQFNDKASSVKVPSGWSVRLFGDADRGGPSICYNQDISDFGTQGNYPGSGTAINDSVSSMEVFNQSTCPPLAPGIPTLVSPANNTVFNRTDTIVMSWNTAANATSYYAELWGGPSINSNSGWTTNTSWSVGQLWGGSYQWRVKSRNAAGTESGWSETRTLTVKYGSPSNLSASAASSTQINLSWNASADAPGNIDGYRVYRNGSAIATVGNSTTSYQNTGLTCGTSYSYTVKAYKGSVESDASNTASATTSSCAGPGIPSPISPPEGAIFNRTDNITLSWNTASNATKYYAELWGGPSISSNSGWITGTSWSIGQLWGGSYQWRVKSGNASGAESAWSVTRNFAVKYGSPSNLSASAASSTQINLSWSTSADEPGNIDGYRIYRNGSAIATVGNSTTSYQNSGLTCGTSYSYTVKAYKGSVESDASNTASATTSPCAPPTPTNFRVTGTTFNSVSLAWDDVAGETGYKIYKWDYQGGVWEFYYLTSVGANVTTFTDSGLSCAVEYFYQVSAYNAAGESARADWVSGITPGCAPSTPPNFVVTGTTAGSVTLVWDDVAGETEYKIYKWGDPGTGWNFYYYASVGADVTTFTDTDLDCATDHYYEVSASNDYGESEHHPWVLGTTGDCAGNDDFDNATTIGNMPYTSSQSTLGATTAYDDPVLPCVPIDQGKASVWYSFTPSSDGLLMVDTESSDFDTVLAVWTGSRGNLTSVACDDDSGSGVVSLLSTELNSNTTYFIEIAQYGTEAGPLSLSEKENVILSGGGNLTLSASFVPNSQPDLVIESITYTPASPTIGQEIDITVRLKNQGNAPLTEFIWLSLYIDRQPYGCFDYMSDYDWSINFLDVGASQDYTTTYPGFSTAGSHSLWAMVDTDCIVDEGNEDNNLSGPANVVVTGGDLIFADGFESGNLSAWSSSVTDAGDLSVNASAALVGSFGLKAVVDSNGAIYLQDNTPVSEPRYRARFYFDPNSIVMASGNIHTILVGRTGTVTPFVLQFRYYNGTYQLRAQALKDNTSYLSTEWYTISDASHYIEIDWKASSAAGANNGYISLWVDGTLKQTKSGVDNDTRRIDDVRLGPSAGVNSGTRGTYYFDAFESRKSTYIGP